MCNWIDRTMWLWVCVCVDVFSDGACSNLSERQLFSRTVSSINNELDAVRSTNEYLQLFELYWSILLQRTVHCIHHVMSHKVSCRPSSIDHFISFNKWSYAGHEINLIWFLVWTFAFPKSITHLNFWTTRFTIMFWNFAYFVASNIELKSMWLSVHIVHDMHTYERHTKNSTFSSSFIFLHSLSLSFSIQNLLEEKVHNKI